MFQCILQVVDLLLSDGGLLQGRQSLDELVPLMIQVDRVAEFPDCIFEHVHQLPRNLSFSLLDLP